MSTTLLDRSAPTARQNQAQSDGKPLAIGEGFTAQSYKHLAFSGLMDPLIMVDHFVMTAPTFGAHAHAGLSAMTLMFEDSEGAFLNRDSLGNAVELAPGDLYWLKAGRGAVHNEEPRPGARTHALQVFVNLPEAHRHDMPTAFHLPASTIPQIASDRAHARLVLGQSNGEVGASAPDISLTLLDINIQAGGRFSHESEGGQHTWILAVSGSLTISWGEASLTLPQGRAVALADATHISMSSNLAAHAVLFQAPPLREPFIQRGPFAMGSEPELAAAEAAHKAGQLGSLT